MGGIRAGRTNAASGGLVACAVRRNATGVTAKRSDFLHRAGQIFDGAPGYRSPAPGRRQCGRHAPDDALQVLQRREFDNYLSLALTELYLDTGFENV